MWLDGADEATFQFDAKDPALVHRWRDKSGAGHVAEQSDRKLRPERSASTAHADAAMVRFSGRQWLRVENIAALQLGGRHTIICVARASEGIILSSETLAASSALQGLCLSSDLATDPSSDLFATLAVHSLLSDGARTLWRLNGMPQGAVELITLDHDGPLTLGRRSIPRRTEYLTGEIAELLIFNRPLNDEELHLLETTLLKKWRPHPPATDNGPMTNDQ